MFYFPLLPYIYMIICSCKDNDFKREKDVLVTDFSFSMRSGIWSDR